MGRDVAIGELVAVMVDSSSTIIAYSPLRRNTVPGKVECRIRDFISCGSGVSDSRAAPETRSTGSISIDKSNHKEQQEP